ncbi:hypothetical protein GCM10008018_30530 [Paenibacillus marchantiophytorum]|uniref:NACHT domain-containing protein n=1 Tax=Paenibacillus marchantiophytorum TaxID=1619310 RepID=A0ABQ1EQG7_9BACL|nr:metallophosphoesterase [Paenibacillus marchantiophytorum]GFZ82611.1 hypothetical protein GCM10008018_30530 [Paenibacillus marchantiophytorum]
MNNTINILHLSDLHFGAEPSSKTTSTLIAKRNNTLKPLFNKLREMESDWKPDIVVVSGDIGWRGAEKDYDIAKDWLRELLTILNLSPNELVVCAGNHDIDRSKTVGTLPPTSAQSADKWLTIETLENFVRPFDNFISFCKEMKIPELSLGSITSYLTGVREIYGLRFVVMNSSWFCRDNNDRGNLWIGLPLLQLMNSLNQLVLTDMYDEAPLTTAVIHHTREWFAGDELHAYERPGAYFYLGSRSHMILSGHVHGRVIPPSKEFDASHLFIGGAGYQGDDYKNNFGILKVNKISRTVTRRSFEFDSTYEKWVEHFRRDEVILKKKVTLPPELPHNNEDPAFNEYLTLSRKATEHALRYVSQKSRSITKSSTLPKLITRKVAVHNKEERIKLSNDERLHLNTINNFAPLSEVVYAGRPTFLFGEIGSGKSTLVGQYCAELYEQNKENICILTSAKFFLNKKIDNIVNFSSHISSYVNENIYLDHQVDFDLLKALKNRIEITLIIDGFDELDRNNSQQITYRLEEMVEHWPHIRVLATGRPIELQEINYSNWQCLELTSLSNVEQELLLYNDALASGMDEQVAKIDANDRFKLLQENNELLTISTSPLVVRLLRPYLNQHQSKKSLGELLYNVLLERLGNWSEKEGKDENLIAFKTWFPNSYSREALLGRIAASIFNSNNGYITKEALYTLIKSEVNNINDTHQTVSQACDYFINSVLQEEGDGYVFPSQPLYQCALGVFILNELLQNKKPSLKSELPALWREYSFAAAVAKRKNVIDDFRYSLQEYIKGLLGDAGARAPVAIIIAESGDHQLAASYINHLSNCEFRPIYYYSGFKSLSSSAYGLCIHLAQDEGFNWFYKNYLDPKYPYSHTLNDIADSILQTWLLYCNFEITTEQSQKLSEIIKPSLSAKSWQCNSLLPTISMVLPTYFNNDIQLLAALNVKKLSSSLLRERAIVLLKELFHRGGKEEVFNALQNTESSNATQLWLELCDAVPHSSIIRNAINYWSSNKKILETIEERIGRKELTSILRWYALQKDKIATYSALILYAFGERNLSFLGSGLLQGLHDGGKVQGAEEVLHELIKNRGKQGIEWLVQQFPKADDFSGAHSAYWRILIEELNNSQDSFTNYLYFASRHLGEFILPRYPDIRRSLAKLLAYKPEYREELYNKGLKSLDNKLRYNIACILLTCSPETESEAADVVIRSTLHSFEKNEWNRFCMRLSLGPEVLIYIYNKLEEYLPVPKVFALMLLYHNNYKLSEDEFKDLVVGLLTRNASSFDNKGIRDNEDTVDKVLSLTVVKDILIKQLQSEDKELVKAAANALWNHHQETLDSEQLITCWVLINTKMNFWTITTIEDWSNKFLNNKEFIKTVIQKIEKETNRETLVGQFIRSYTDVSAWRDILWSSMFTTSGYDHQQIEHAFLWLLNKGMHNELIGKTIGSSALEFLEHPSIIANKMYNTAVPWLAFLAHEFGELPSDKLEYIIINYEPIGQEIVCVLIARLRYIPQKLRIKRDRDYLLTNLKKEVKLVLSFEELVEITRDAEEIHDNFAKYIESILTTNNFKDEDLEQVATKSRFGGIFASIIWFCRGSLDNYDSLIHSISLEFTRTNQNRSANIVVNSLEIIRLVISTDSKESNAYFKAIEKTIETNNHENIILLFEELLEYQQDFTISLLPLVLEELVSNPYKLNINLAAWLSDYFAYKIKEDQKVFVINELKKAVLSLNSSADRFSSNRNSIAKWLFSLAVIYLVENIDSETERLFLIALSSLFIEEPMREHRNLENKRYFKARDILNSVHPLFEKVPFDRLRRILLKGSTSDVPEINTCCRILLALSGQ